jgi:hypothetical protein
MIKIVARTLRGRESPFAVIDDVIPARGVFGRDVLYQPATECPATMRTGHGVSGDYAATECPVTLRTGHGVSGDYAGLLDEIELHILTPQTS